MKINSLLLKDFYKAGHPAQYPIGTEFVYSNFTNRKSRYEEIEETVFFGLQYYLKAYLVDHFNENLFNKSLEDVIFNYKRRIKNSLGADLPTYKHIEGLHKLGYLPLKIKALPEGSLVPIRVPVLTITNTLPEFYWLVNCIETQMSASIWKPSTSATIAYQYRKILNKFAEETGMPIDFVKWQGHDFSMRGMSSIESGIISGMGHLTSFAGTDTIPAIDGLEQYYNANSDNELIGGSVPATEHSVMCSGEKDCELETFKRLITEIYPNGIVSIVSDTWDLWKVCTEYLTSLKEIILKRNGKVVIRPDSGDPVKILCGDEKSSNLNVKKGVIELLWDIFGGTITSKGFKLLDSHIGAIYGDSINLERAETICKNLQNKGFSSQAVFGVGSFCVSPETLILCDDLIWREAKNLEINQGIIAFDENPKFGGDKRAARCYKQAKIENNEIIKKNCYKLISELGEELILSEDHPCLIWVKNRSKENTFIGNDIKIPKKIMRTPGLGWKMAKDLRVGDKLAFFTKPWKVENSRSDGWLEGIYDGEGCLSKSTGEERIPAWKVNISQNKGIIYDRIRKELKNKDFTFYKNDRKCPQIVITGGWLETIRFLGIVRPKRLLKKLSNILKRMPALKRNSTFKLSPITKIEKIGLHEVSSITTSCGTFITNGYLTHNTYQYNTRDTFGSAIKATHVTINGKHLDIFKNPVTDDGMKKSLCGLLKIEKDENGKYFVKDKQGIVAESQGELKTVFNDGKIVLETSLKEIRQRLHGNNF